MKIRIKKDTLIITSVVMVLALAFFVVKMISLHHPRLLMPQETNLITIFLTGLLTGGLTCLAVQGGLLAATIAQREEEKLAKKVTSGNSLPILAFLGAKLVSYTILGFLLGAFGSLFQLSIVAQVVMQLVVVLFMLGTAGNILNLHPFFRYFAIQPPKFLTRMVRKQSKSTSLFAPALLGGFTVFIPCGTTQAMMALAIASASPLMGAAVLCAFILGTSPIFFILGYFTTTLGESLHKKFMRIAAAALIVLALFNLNNALALTGSQWTLTSVFSSQKSASVQTSIATNPIITIENSGYSPQVIHVKAGSKVTLKIRNEGAYSCASAFTIPAYNYQKIIDVGKTETITLTMPDKPTQIPFMCSMGMYRGVIDVI